MSAKTTPQQTAMNTRQREELAALCQSVRWRVDMAAYSTFRAGGTVEALVDLQSTGELVPLLRWLGREQIPWSVLGGGSNILVTGQAPVGLFIRLRGSVGETVADRLVDGVQVRVPAGCSLAALLGWCARHDVGGLEFMAGVPGTVGGAIRMNAGALGRSIGEVLTTVYCVTEHGVPISVARKDMTCTYRSTRLPGEPGTRMVITGGLLKLQPADGRQVAVRYKEIIQQRRNKQPQGVSSAGSFFKNPPGDFAGRLIEQAGLKGCCRGKAMVSPQHANFIVNTGGAQPDDILDLMAVVQQKVWQDSGIMLEPEVRIY